MLCRCDDWSFIIEKLVSNFESDEFSVSLMMDHLVSLGKFGLGNFVAQQLALLMERVDRHLLFGYV